VFHLGRQDAGDDDFSQTMPPRLRPAAVLAAATLALAAPAAEAKVEATFNGGIVTVTGDEGDNVITVICTPDGNVLVNGENPKGGAVACARVVEVDANPLGGNDTVDFSGIDERFGEARFPGFGKGTGAGALLGLGNDTYLPSADSFNLVDGEFGKDRIDGGPRRDLLTGGPGVDVIRGGDGRDTLFGNGDDDRIFGQDGADTISGHGGSDFLNGGAGADAIGGGNGRDRLIGGPGGDKLLGGLGRDVIRGGPGKDREVQDPAKKKS
jgi:Ca2+-binding RTX toxin-like protein